MFNFGFLSRNRLRVAQAVFCYNKIMKKRIKTIKLNKKYLIAGLISLLTLGGGLFAGSKLFVKTDIKTKTEIEFSDYKIELSAETVETLIETEDGQIEVIQAPTVEAIDGGNINCENEGGECGLGKYIYAPTDTPYEFKDYTLNKCWDTDDFPSGAKAQCWDLGDLFWQNYAGRNLSTCGTGGAYGAWNCKEYNAGNEFDLIYDPKELKVGDWVIFHNGRWGHVGMALGGYNNGYVALLGQNQGGATCPEGGQATNIINISLNDFSGAFRPKSYEKPSPEPEPTPLPISGCDIWNVEDGDTMSGIMLACENTVVYGEAMDNYAKSWYSLKVKPNQSVYDGWHSETGVGLYAGDDIEHRTN